MVCLASLVLRCIQVGRKKQKMLAKFCISCTEVHSGRKKKAENAGKIFFTLWSKVGISLRRILRNLGSLTALRTGF